MTAVSARGERSCRCRLEKKTPTRQLCVTKKKETVRNSCMSRRKEHIPPFQRERMQEAAAAKKPAKERI